MGFGLRFDNGPGLGVVRQGSRVIVIPIMVEVWLGWQRSDDWIGGAVVGRLMMGMVWDWLMGCRNFLHVLARNWSYVLIFIFVGVLFSRCSWLQAVNKLLPFFWQDQVGVLHRFLHSLCLVCSSKATYLLFAQLDTTFQWQDEIKCHQIRVISV